MEPRISISSRNRRLSVENVIEESIGSIGRWHYEMIAWIFLIRCPVAFHQLALAFLANNPSFICENTTTDSCSSNCTEHDSKSDWDMVCEKAFLAEIGQSAAVSGIFLGNIIFGIVSDKYGRRISILIAIACQAVSGVLASFSWSLYGLIALRFLIMTATGGTVCTCFILLVEIIGIRKRTLLGILFQLPYSFSFFMLPLVAYFVRSWKYFQLTISIPSMLFLIFCFVITESPRWLLIVGETEQAIQLLETIAKKNKRDPSTIRPIILLYKRNHEKQSANVFEIFKDNFLRKSTIFVSFLWLANGFGLYGTSIFLRNIGGNVYTEMAVCASLQLPALIFPYWFIRHSGKKKTVVYTTLLGGACLIGLVLGVCVNGIQLFITLLASMGTVFMTMTSTCAFLYTSELYPTVVRNFGLGFCWMWSKVGIMTSPILYSLVRNDEYVPPLVFGILQLTVAIAVSAHVPNFKDWQFIDTLQQARLINERNVF